MDEKRMPAAAILRRLAHEWWPYWPHMTGILLLSLISAPLALLAPLAIKIVVDSFIGVEPLPGFIAWVAPDALTGGRQTALWVAVGLALGVAFLTQLQGLASTLLRVYTSERLVLGFRTRLFPHVQRLTLRYHDAKGTSDSTYRILYDTAVVPAILIDGVVPLITALVTLGAMIYVVAQLSPQLAVVALMITPVLALLSYLYNRRLREQWHGVKKLASEALSILQEVLSALRVVKAFGKEESEQERLVYVARENMKAIVRVTFTKATLDASIGIFVAIGMAAVLYLGATQVRSGLLTLGELLMIIAYLSMLYGPLQVVLTQSANLQGSFSSAERALALLDEVPEVAERPHARPLDRARGDISLEGVCFAYDPNQPVLHDVSFDIEAGARIGIAGETGSGKTTLMNLLTRLYDPTAGVIRVDGVDLRDYKLADLREQFAIVLQEPLLFSKSIGANIAYARPEAGPEEIREAARQANAHEFIERLPEGYDTLVGERGVRLSGGQRQRVSLARAFLKNAPILILDEPTSSVDMRTEAAILDAMNRLMKERTTFIIAHRLNTLEFCDRVLVMREGRVVFWGDPLSDALRNELLSGGTIPDAPDPAV